MIATFLFCLLETLIKFYVPSYKGSLILLVPFSTQFWPIIIVKVLWSFPDGSEDKESACNAGDTGNMGSITESRRSPGEEMATHSSILVWEIPWIEEPGRLQSMGLQRVRQDWTHVNYIHIREK